MHTDLISLVSFGKSVRWFFQFWSYHGYMASQDQSNGSGCCQIHDRPEMLCRAHVHWCPQERGLPISKSTQLWKRDPDMIPLHLCLGFSSLLKRLLSTCLSSHSYQVTLPNSCAKYTRDLNLLTIFRTIFYNLAFCPETDLGPWVPCPNWQLVDVGKNSGKFKTQNPYTDQTQTLDAAHAMLGSIADFDHLCGCGGCHWVPPSTQPPQHTAAAGGACAPSTGSVGIGAGGKLVWSGWGGKVSSPQWQGREKKLFFLLIFHLDTSKMSQIFLCDKKWMGYFRCVRFSSWQTNKVYHFCSSSSQ